MLFKYLHTGKVNSDKILFTLISGIFHFVTGVLIYVQFSSTKINIHVNYYKIISNNVNAKMMICIPHLIMSK